MPTHPFSLLLEEAAWIATRSDHFLCFAARAFMSGFTERRQIVAESKVKHDRLRETLTCLPPLLGSGRLHQPPVASA